MLKIHKLYSGIERRIKAALGYTQKMLGRKVLESEMVKWCTRTLSSEQKKNGIKNKVF